MKDKVLNRLQKKFLGETKIKYTLDSLPGRRYELRFDTSIPASFFTSAIEKAMDHFTKESVDVDAISSFSADERLAPKLVKKLQKHIVKIEKDVACKKCAPRFCLTSKTIPKDDGFVYKRVGDMITISIRVLGTYAY